MVKKNKLIIWLVTIILVCITLFTDKYFFIMDKVSTTTYVGCKLLLFIILSFIWTVLVYLFSKKGLRYLVLFYIPIIIINLFIFTKIDISYFIDNIKVLNLSSNYIANTLGAILYMILPIKSGIIYMESFLLSIILAIIVSNTKNKERNLIILFIGIIPSIIFIYLGRYLVSRNYLIIYTMVMFVIYLLTIKNNRALFISSTGGHLEELFQLKPLMDKYNYYIVTEKTDTNKNLVSKYPGRVGYLVYGTRKDIFKYIFVILINIFISLYIFFKIRPNVIITTGTHTAVPMCFIGKIFGSKIVYIETFANRETKTLAGRVVYPIADIFVVQWEEMLKLYPKAIYFGGVY